MYKLFKQEENFDGYDVINRNKKIERLCNVSKAMLQNVKLNEIINIDYDGDSNSLKWEAVVIGIDFIRNRIIYVLI